MQITVSEDGSSPSSYRTYEYADGQPEGSKQISMEGYVDHQKKYVLRYVFKGGDVACESTPFAFPQQDTAATDDG